MRIEDDLLVAEGSVFSGCRVRGREGHLLLLEERPQRCRFKATTAATALCATVSLEQRQGVKLAVEEAKIQFQDGSCVGLVWRVLGSFVGGFKLILGGFEGDFKGLNGFGGGF